MKEGATQFCQAAKQSAEERQPKRLVTARDSGSFTTPHDTSYLLEVPRGALLRRSADTNAISPSVFLIVIQAFSSCETRLL